MEECDELHGEVRGQARMIPRGDRDGQGVGEVERGSPACAVGDSESEPQRRLQSQAGLPEAGEDEGERASTPSYGVYTARERCQVA